MSVQLTTPHTAGSAHPSNSTQVGLPTSNPTVERPNSLPPVHPSVENATSGLGFVPAPTPTSRSRSQSPHALPPPLPSTSSQVATQPSKLPLTSTTQAEASTSQTSKPAPFLAPHPLLSTVLIALPYHGSPTHPSLIPPSLPALSSSAHALHSSSGPSSPSQPAPHPPHTHEEEVPPPILTFGTAFPITLLPSLLIPQSELETWWDLDPDLSLSGGTRGRRGRREEPPSIWEVRRREEMIARERVAGGTEFVFSLRSGMRTR